MEKVQIAEGVEAVEGNFMGEVNQADSPFDCRKRFKK